MTGGWRLHGDGRTIGAGEVVTPDERLTWPRTMGIGMQHVLAMFGATFLVPIITGFPVTTTLLFSGLGTLLFLVVTGNRLPSYLGSSFAFIAPVAASVDDGGVPQALGGIVVAGAAFAAVGLAVMRLGTGWIDRLMPPVVTGSIVALIGLNLAPAAYASVQKAPVTAVVTLVVILLGSVLFTGFLGRLSIVIGVLVGYLAAAAQGQLDFSKVRAAGWVGAPHLTGPHVTLGAAILFLPVVFVLVAENVGHVKAVASMTDRNLDHVVGRAFLGDGLATVLAGFGGGSGTTTYAENIGVMAASRVYSTAAYWVAGATAVALSFLPKFGELVNTVPAGVIGGATTVLYGLIGVLGARIWVEARVDFTVPVNLYTAAVSLIIGVANYTVTRGHFTLNGIALGAFAALAVHHLLGFAARRRGGPRPGPVLDRSESSPLPRT
jgi:uracil-xanthine permease